MNTVKAFFLRKERRKRKEMARRLMKADMELKKTKLDGDDQSDLLSMDK